MPASALGELCPKCLLAAGLEDREAPHLSAAADSEAATTPPHGKFLPPDPATLAAHFPQLEIVELLGYGGMGAVYKARQLRLDRIVALKIVRPEFAEAPAFAERFNREARMLARLNHPHIVAVHDFGEVRVTNASAGGEQRPLYYLLMEYVDGVNLRQLMQAGELIPQQALAVVPQICDALQFAHDAGVVHRDIKPENILLDQHGRVKIADFGLAKLAGRSAKDFTLTDTHQVMGTPRYMAPEQMEGSHAVDHRADIFSLGVVFYEMLTGEVPVGHFEPPSKKVEVDVRLDEIVLRALAREPDRRYQHASDVKTDVDSIAKTTGAIPRTSAASVAWPYWTPSWGLYAACSAVLALMLYALFAAIYGTSFSVFSVSRTIVLPTCAAIVMNAVLAYWIESRRFDAENSWKARRNLVTLALGLLMLMVPSIVLSPVDLKHWLPAHWVAFTDSEERWLRTFALGIYLWTFYFVGAHILFALGRSVRRGRLPDGEAADASLAAREPERRYEQVGDVISEVYRPQSESFPSPKAHARTSLPPGVGPRLLLISGGMVLSALVIAAGLALLLLALLRESAGSGAFWGWIGGAFGCLIGGAGSLAGAWNSYRQLEGAPDLWEELNQTWFDRAMRIYTFTGVVAMVSASVLSLWLPWYPVGYSLMLLGGIVTFQGVVFLVIRGLTRRASRQELVARQASNVTGDGKPIS